MAVLLTIPALSVAPGLVHAFSTSALGSMARPRGSASHLTPARRAFAERLRLPADRLTVPRAVHGGEVARVDEPAGVVPGVDGLLTDRVGLPLLLTCADCYAIILWDHVRRALALVHAGWRGTAAGIAGRAVAALRDEYGSRPRDLLVGLGPGICGRCYEVGAEVAERFAPEHLRPSPRPGRFLLDVAAANRDQLRAAGVPAARIHAHGACTKETPELASHRRAPDGSRFACLAAIR
jgi:YfiH family protein